MTEHRVGEQFQFSIGESSQVAEARRKATALACATGLDENRAGICALVASEMGTNLVKHAKEGEIFLRAITEGAMQGIEVMALDRGPGMVNVSRALQDGYSTAGSSGTGLGAIVRMATEFDIFSMPGRGTGLVARVWKGAGLSASSPQVVRTGVINLAKTGESVSGDGWYSESSSRRTVCAVVDGLGHGPLAARAAVLAVESLREHHDASLSEQIDFAHGALRSTRGAALGVAEILHDQGLVKFVGIGNIMAAVHQDGVSKSMVSQNGILGHQIRRVTEFQYLWSESAMLVMCSDGINTHWDVNQYAGLAGRDPSLIAATLYRDFTRGRDDTTVLVIKTTAARSETNPSAP